MSAKVVMLVIAIALAQIFVFSPKTNAETWVDDMATMKPGDGWSFNVFRHSVRALWFADTDDSTTMKLFVQYYDKDVGVVGSIYSPDQINELAVNTTINPKGRLSLCTEAERRMFHECDAKWIGARTHKGKWLLTLRNDTDKHAYVFVWIDAGQ